MSLTPGTRLGPYEVSAQIGVGGMGEVYRALDTSLGRQVAIKILPDSVAHDPDRLARFEREAKTLAALNHPNIAQIYGLDQSDGVRALVMELVEGPTLADVIVATRGGAAARGLDVGKALPIAKQIAEALESAHEQGIIHRDLKPANIKVRPDGTVKVLDFGLAKALEPTSGMGPNMSVSPTITSPAMTGTGVILGTAAYMSPEQARGRAVDKRSDVWAFGCVLFEMLTGTRAFGGDDVTDTLAYIITKEPDWNALQTTTPPSLRRLIVRCLAKDVKQRLHDIADVRMEIEDTIAARLRGEPAAIPSASAPRLPRWGLTALIAALCTLAGLALGVAIWRRPAAAPHVTHATLGVEPANEVSTDSVLGMLPAGSRTALAWSPDGRTLAFVGVKAGVRQIYLRDLDRDTARPLDGTEGARSVTFSADGEWIAFWADQQIRKVRATGGPPAKICDAEIVSGISWGATRIVFSGARQLFDVSGNGGEPRALNKPTNRVSSPVLLPGDEAVLYTAYDKVWTSGDERVMVQPLNGGEARVLLREAADARYLATGHLMFVRQGTVFVAPFDATTLKVRGGEVAVLKGVAQAVASWFGGDLTVESQFAVSPQGSVAYVASPTPSIPTSELVTVNRTGKVTPLGAPITTYRERIESSPNGTTFAVSVQTTRNVRLFLYDSTRGTLSPAFAESVDREAVRPLWSSDGKIAVHFIQGSTSQVAVFRPDSPAPPEIISGSENFTPSGWSYNGERLVGSKAGDLWVYAPASSAESKWKPLAETPATERFPVWSSDGQWLAYVSDVSGRDEVYVRPYPGPGTPIPVSTNGGRSPAWNPKGRELFYTEMHPGEENDWRMLSVEMTDPQHPGKPALLFPFSSGSLLLPTCSPTACYSVAPNGQEFYTLRMVARQPLRVGQIQLIINWTEELKRLVPTK